MTDTRPVCAALLIALCSTVTAQDLAPLEAYGALPEVDLFELSPSGRYAAFRRTSDGEDLILVADLEDRKFVSGANVAEVNPRRLDFVTEDRLVLVAGRTVRSMAVRKSFDYSQAYVLETDSGDVRRLLHRVDKLYPYQSGLGRIIGVDRKSRKLFMPAFIDSAGDPPHGVFSVPLDSSGGRVVLRGRTQTRDWLVDEQGIPIAREDFDDHRNRFQIWMLKETGGRDRLLYEIETEFPHAGFVGITDDRAALVVRLVDAETDASSLFLMSLEDGSLSGPVLSGNGLEVDRVIADTNRVVYGVEYAGFKPSYAFFDERVNERIESIQERLGDASGRLVSWSAGFEKLLFHVEGGWSSGTYLVFESGSQQPRVLEYARPQIEGRHVASVAELRYTARDGLEIPALLTYRTDVLEAAPAPTIVMPHGGPKSHDEAGFNWIAQYFASRGYVVLQPQFRGSDGFGQTLEEAGRGQWGSGMQYDIDDGTQFLINEGIADPQRICIVGWSYGGYAALWAGAFSVEMYECVAAIAPVTDLPRMLRSEKAASDRNWVIDYWESLYGAEASEKQQLRDISPAYHAENFEAPVLLVHGRKDTVVRYDQSKVMEKALRKAGKDVTLVDFKSEDHWMSQAATRIEMLRAVAAFIEKHL